jgi:type IV pilus assembly protein PilM
MAKKIVSLYFDDTSIRLLVTHGERIKKWADLPLESGLIKNAVVLKQAAVADKIKQLFQVRKLKAKKVIIGISGLHCLTRPITLPQLPNEMLEEAVRREAKRLLPVPPEQLYLSWQTIPAPAGKIQVFLVAVPRKLADALFKTLQQAGLKSDLMDIKPLLLSRVVKEATAIIVDVQPTEFDIVIMADGIPQPIRTVNFPGKVLSWQEKLPMIRDELNRTFEFYNSNDPENPLAAAIPIFVSGDLAHESELWQSLSDELGHPVLPLSSPLDCPVGLEPNRYLANMGLILKELSPEKEAVVLIPNLNVLPAVYRPEPISLTRVLALPSAVIALSLLFFLVILIQNTSADIGSIRSELNTAEQLLQQKSVQRQTLTGKITELENKITEAKTSGGNFAAAMATLEKQTNGVSGNLEVAVNSLPDAIKVTSISQTSPTLTVKGKAPSEEEILLYLRELDASGRFSEITVTSLKRINYQRMDFSLILIGGE